MEEALISEKISKFKTKEIFKKIPYQVITVLLIVVLILGQVCNIIRYIQESVITEQSFKYTTDTGTIAINDDGTFSTAISAQELWDNLVDQGYDLEKYLDTPEELITLVNAQNAMQLPDISPIVNDSNNNNEPKKLNALVTTDNKNTETNGNSTNAVIEAAKTQLGQPYNYSGSHADPKPPQGGGTGFNCSGLVWWAFEQAGYQVPHSQCIPGAAKPNRGMIDVVYNNCGGRLRTNPSELNPGDVLFYRGNGRESGHVAIYMGNNQRIHANGTAVVIDSTPFNEDFIGGGPLVNGIASTRTAGGIVNDSLKGIIRFLRHDQDGNEFYLLYADPTTFQNQIELYNKSGSESAREFVMTHFTLKENPMKAISGTIYGTGSFTKYNLSENQLNTLARICLREQGSAKGAAAEASLMANLFELAGGSFGNGADGLYNYVMTSGWFGIPGDHNAPSSVDNEVLTAVKAVLMQGYRTLPKYVNEHDCINPPDIIDPPARREDFIPFQTVLHNIYGSTYTFYCFPTEDSDPFGYTSEANRQKYGDFCYEYGTWIPINGVEDTSMDDVKVTGGTSTTIPTSGGDLLWPSRESTEITSPFGPRNTGIAGASTNHKGIDIGASEGSEALAAESGTVCEKVGEAQGGARGNYITLDHGNGLKTRYQHLSRHANLNVGDRVTKGQVVGYVGHTGVGSGPHLHFEVLENDTAVDPLNYKYSNGMGNGTSSFSGDSGSTVQSQSSEDSSAPGYQAVVGTFREVDKYVNTEGTDIETVAEKFGVSLDDTPEYTLSTTTVNYEDLVQPYVMKFDFLCALLVICQNKDFVMDIAKLAYDSDLEVSIYDTVTTTTDVDNYTYTKATDAQIVGNASFNGYTARFIDNHYYEDGNPYLQSDGSINRKIVTRTNTVQYALTRADTWYIDYKQSYDRNENKGTTSYGGGAIDNIVLEGWHKADLSDHRCGVIVEAIQKVIQSANADLKRAYTSEKRLTPDLPEPELYSYDENKGSVKVNYIKQKARTQLVNINHSTEDTTDISTYTPGTKEAVFKDCNKKELSPNFVTLYNSAKYRGVRNTMEISWLIEIMEANENLANITQIFKYLWYKATNQNLGVTELDVTSYYPGALQSIGGQSLSGEAYVGASAVISRALSKEGYPYQINTQGPNTFDCSGFVSYALSGKYIRYTNDVIISWPHIDISEAKPGDVVVICNSSPPNYSGRHSALIYDNDLNIIEAVPDRIVKGSRNARDMVNRGYVIVRPPSNVINPNP